MDIFSQDCNSRPDFSHDLKLYCSSSFDRLHIHKSSELILVREGRLEITVASRAFSLESGDAILVLPFEPHAFDGSRAKFVVHLFAERYAEEFFRILGGKKRARAGVQTDARIGRILSSLFRNRRRIRLRVGVL